MTSKSRLLPETMSGSMAQLQPGSVLKSVAQVATKVNAEAQNLGQRLQLGWSLRAVSQQGLYRYGLTALLPGVLVSSGPRQLLRAVPGSVVLQQQGSGLMYGVPAATKRHEDAQGHQLPGSGWCPRARDVQI